MPSLGWPELLIILVVALLLFGGSRLAGVGKGTGRAIREFKEETKGLRDADAQKKADAAAAGSATTTAATVDDSVVRDTAEQARVGDDKNPTV